MIEFACGAATHVGRVRQSNQDALFAGKAMFAVADGLGGHNGGEVASAIAVETLQSAPSPATIFDFIDLAHEANTRIEHRAETDNGLWNMGTTLSALALLSEPDPPRLGMVNAGDSRVYRLDGDRLQRCTIDHSYVEQLVREGRISREEADVHPQRNQLTRALGLRPLLVDGWELTPVAGDRYLICSDGLYGEIDDDETAGLLADTAAPQAAADLLVSCACDAGGHDNVTVVIVDIVETGPEAAGPSEPPDDRVLSEHLDVPESI